MIDESDARGHEKRQKQQGSSDGYYGRARRRQYDELAVAIEAVERMNGGDQQRERGDDRHQVRQRQRRHLNQHPGVLPLRGHDVELTKCQGDPHDAR